MVDMKQIEGLLRNNPLSLLSIRDKQVISQINNLVPYSIGMDIECHKDRNVYKDEAFKAIPDIMNVQNDDWEQRYRIPNGLRGIICLYNLSIQLKVNSLLNPESSIHYHVDCTDVNWDNFKNVGRQNDYYILSELDTWICEDEDRSKITSRREGGWFKFNDLKTLEFRLGEMTFEYRWMLKRIIHCCKIVKRFKDQLNAPSPVFKAPDIKRLVEYERINVAIGSSHKGLLTTYERLKSEVEDDKPLIDSLESIRPQVRNRIHKIGE